ncbi:MAG: rhomboid family intramembrane serine protease [Pseudoflavonifractor sp.]
MNFLRRIHYNAPVILTFFLLSLAALGLSMLTGGWTTEHLFSVYRSSPLSPLFYVRLLGHVLGHANWAHFTGNMLLLLVVGPPLEEKYGSSTLLVGILLTALISGLLQCFFFPGTALLGASGIVFMLIMLSSLAGMRAGSIPLTLILVGLLYLGQEVYSALFVQNNVANFMHLVGGACGTVFGYAVARRSL